MGQQTQLTQRCNDKLSYRTTATTLELPNHAARATQVRTSHGETHAERSELLSTSAPCRSQTCARGRCEAFWGSLSGEAARGPKRRFISLRKHMCERQRARSPACASEASPLPRSPRATASPPRASDSEPATFWASDSEPAPPSANGVSTCLLRLQRPY